MDKTTSYTLVNPAFTFSFNGKDYQVHKANLEQALQYQKRVKEIKDGGRNEMEIIAYCIFLVLKSSAPDDTEITEDYILKNTPADIDGLECLVTLGFTNPKQLEMTRNLQKEMIQKLITDSSSSSSPTAQDGLPEKSVS